MKKEMDGQKEEWGKKDMYDGWRDGKRKM